MITWKDLYTVISAVVPLYVTMFFAYGSVKWWKVFSPEQCAGINKFVAVFAVPLLSFEFISRINPYKLNFTFIAADVVSKAMALLVLGLWAKWSHRGSLDWVITLFSLSTLPNTLVMGIPILKAMYGDSAENLMVQTVVLQSIIWYTILLFLYEYRSAKMLHDNVPSILKERENSSLSRDAQVDADNERIHVVVRKSSSSSFSQRFNSAASSQRLQISNSLHLMPIMAMTHSDLDMAYKSVHSSRNLQCPMDSSYKITREMVSEKTPITPSEGIFSDDSLTITPHNAVQLRKMASPSATNYRPDLEDECAKEVQKFVWSCESSLLSEVITDPEQLHKEVSVYRDFSSEHKLPMGDGDFVIEKEDHKLPESISKATPALIAIKVDKSDGKDLSEPNSPHAAAVMRIILGMVGRKLLCNPNSYSSVIGMIWALISARLHVGLPPMVQGSVTILSNAGLGMAMFSLGLFMALQPRIIACGTSLALLAMLVRFLAGPAFMGIASIATGLRGTVWHLSIVQAALPQGIVPFVFAREYDLHSDILSTAVIFGMLVSLPITVAYYVVLEVHS